MDDEDESHTIHTEEPEQHFIAHVPVPSQKEVFICVLQLNLIV